jgi:hypothetical protein
MNSSQLCTDYLLTIIASSPRKRGPAGMCNVRALGAAREFAPYVWVHPDDDR